MIHDLRDAGDLPVGDCDVCIVGAGPAGIVLALELARARPQWHIVVTEAGGTDMPSPDDNDPYNASTSETAYPLAASRLRFLGGTSNHWGGWCRPLDPHDFLSRDDIALSGWPISHDEVAAHHARAAQWCEVDATDYETLGLVPQLDDLIDFSASSLLGNGLFRFSPPTRFGTRYRAELAEQENLDLLLHASANGLEFSGERVSGVHLAGYGGTALLRARQVVLAMGGVENARMLMLHAGKGGRGSGLASPMLGRCFADHAGFRPARLLLPANLGYQRRQHESGPLMPIITLDPQAQRELRLPNVFMRPLPQADVQQIDLDFAHNRALGFIADEYWNHDLQVLLDPEPNPDSRLTLTDETDSLGMRRVHLDWRITAADRARGERLLPFLASELGALGLGRLRLLPQDARFDREPSVTFHHMGTTRMSIDNEAGVVDGHGRVHGCENLYVAGSSVFPTFGISNPTLTIVALAVRQAARLAQTGAGEQA